MSASRCRPISVVIPLFNKARYVRRAVDSVLAQDYGAFELIVVNDGSTDQGPQIVRAYGDPRIRVIDQTNQGVSSARNRGIGAARGDLIAFLDADDEWLGDFLSTIAGLAARFPAAGVYVTGYRLLKAGQGVYLNLSIKGKRATSGCYFDFAGSQPLVSASSVAVSRAAFSEVGGFRVDFHLDEDVDMWFRLGLRHAFAYSPRICALYHQYLSDSACHAGPLYEASPLYVSLSEMSRDASLDPVVRAKATRYLAGRLAEEIEFMLYNGSRRAIDSNLRHYRQAFGINPSYVKVRTLSLLPSRFLHAAIAARLSAVRWALGLRSKFA